MKKTYWWRILISLFVLVLLCVIYIIHAKFLKPFFFFSLLLFIASIFLFFISDKIFLKWLKFATAWVVISIILIIFAPTSGGAWLPMNPTKELVSIWMGSLFVILSLIQIIWQSLRERRG